MARRSIYAHSGTKVRLWFANVSVCWWCLLCFRRTDANLLFFCCQFAAGLVLEDAGMTHPDDDGRGWEVCKNLFADTRWRTNGLRVDLVASCENRDVPNNNTDKKLHLPTMLRHWTS
ncbi:hypothetical protein PybrP1_002115 [[Pythium] brassicae (nom. inval.)]|nr:hypothetical protein PybrP1_002115 [[Pythium] brassicae (nom. inval.)]